MNNQTIMQRYERAYREEFNASGSLPKVAILGWLDFEELAGAVSTFYGLAIPDGSLDELKKVQTFEFQGIQIFKSRRTERGMMFASVEVVSPQYENVLSVIGRKDGLIRWG